MLEFPFIFGFGMMSNWKLALACNCAIFLCQSGYPWSTAFYYPLANKVAKGYSNATVRPSVTSLWTL